MIAFAARFVAACAVWALVAGIARGETQSDSWPTFRGARAHGHIARQGAAQEWPEGGPKLVWKAAGAGRGYSSLAIAGGRIYTLGDAPSTGRGSRTNTWSASTRPTASNCGRLRPARPGPKANRPGKARAARRPSTAIASMSSRRTACWSAARPTGKNCGARICSRISTAKRPTAGAIANRSWSTATSSSARRAARRTPWSRSTK